MKHLERELSLKPLMNDVNDFNACFQSYRDIVNGELNPESEDRHAFYSSYVAMIDVDGII